MYNLTLNILSYHLYFISNIPNKTLYNIEGYINLTNNVCERNNYLIFKDYSDVFNELKIQLLNNNLFIGDNKNFTLLLEKKLNKNLTNIWNDYCKKNIIQLFEKFNFKNEIEIYLYISVMIFIIISLLLTIILIVVKKYKMIKNLKIERNDVMLESYKYL